MSVESDDRMHGHSYKSPACIRDLIPGSLLATLRGDLSVSDPAVCDGDDVYEVDATTLASNRVGGFAATESLESWMLPETELGFLRCVVGRDDASYVEDFIANAETNHQVDEKSLFLALGASKTILNRQTKLVLQNPKLREKTSNASKPLKRMDYVLEECPRKNQTLIPNGDDNESAPWIKSKTKPYNVHLNANKVPMHAIAPETPADRRRDDGNRPAPVALQRQQQYQQQQGQQHRQHQQRPHQNGIFFPPPRGQNMFVYGPPPTTVMPYLPGFVCQRRPWPSNFYQPFPIQPLYFLWHPIDNAAQLPHAVVTGEREKTPYSHPVDQQKQYDKNDFGNDECINKIISIIETKDEDALRNFLLLLKSIYPKKLEDFNKIMVLMDYLNSQLHK